MADSKISALPASTTPLAGTETLPIVQSGVTKQVSVANLTVGRAVGSAGGTFTDNHVQGTAAKGINFTANTPAAGMTSQLLNWYEEGAWTPTDASGAGLSIAITSGTTPKYTRIGNVVFFSADITYPSTANSDTAKISLPLATTSSNPLGTGSVGYKSDGVAVYPSVSSSGVNFLGPVNTFQTNANLSGVRFVFSGTYFAA